MYTVSHRTSGRLKASHRKAIGGGVWLHLGASRCDLREAGKDVGRTRSSDDIMLVGLASDLRLKGDSCGEVVVGLRTGLELEGDVDGVVDGCSEERVVRFVSFVGDSVGGGKSLG